jgi:hypothetical protein
MKFTWKLKKSSYKRAVIAVSLYLYIIDKDVERCLNKLQISKLCIINNQRDITNENINNPKE